MPESQTATPFVVQDISPQLSAHPDVDDQTTYHERHDM